MNKKLLAILLSLTVMMSMVFAGTAAAFAGDEPEAGAVLLDESDVPEELADDAEPVEIEAEPEDTGFEDLVLDSNITAKQSSLNSYGHVTPANINKGEGDINTVNNYSGYYYYYVDMPSAGTLILKQYNSAGSSVYPTVNGFSSTYAKTLDDGTVVRTYAIPSQQSVLVSYYLSASDDVYFQANYAPNTANTVTAPVGKFSSVYSHGGTGTTSTTTKFKVKVNYPGYLALDIADDSDYAYSVQLKTTGFKDYENIPSNNIRRYIGVKKGTYTFTVKSFAPVYNFKVRLYKVTQNKYGASKKKAVSLKAKKTYKGLIVTNAKKVHWYKFKNTKLHKVSIIVKAKCNDGGSYGAYKVTLYDKKGSIGTSYLYGDTASKTLNPYTIGKGSKLVKGTYWVKVESYTGGNGYFSIMWK